MFIFCTKQFLFVLNMLRDHVKVRIQLSGSQEMLKGKKRKKIHTRRARTVGGYAPDRSRTRILDLRVHLDTSGLSALPRERLRLYLNPTSRHTAPGRPALRHTVKIILLPYFCKDYFPSLFVCTDLVPRT